MNEKICVLHEINLSAGRKVSQQFFPFHTACNKQKEINQTFPPLTRICEEKSEMGSFESVTLKTKRVLALSPSLCSEESHVGTDRNFD